MYILKRSKSCKDGTFGYLWKDESPFSLTLEPVVPIIAPGEYECIRYKGKVHSYEVFLIQNVVGHDGVEIHIGNVVYDTIGCILIGVGLATFNHNVIEHIPSTAGDVRGITFSGSAFDKLMTTEKQSFILKVG